MSGGSGGGVSVRNQFGAGVNTDTTITGNTITGNHWGISVGAEGIDSDDAVVANDNVISGNDIPYINRSDSFVLDATENFWGSAAGPGPLANVTTIPWCTVTGLRHHV